MSRNPFVVNERAGMAIEVMPNASLFAGRAGTASRFCSSGEISVFPVRA